MKEPIARQAGLTGSRVGAGFRMPDEPDELPTADAAVVALATVAFTRAATLQRDWR